jgi:hypothetical protein
MAVDDQVLKGDNTHITDIVLNAGLAKTVEVDSIEEN